MSDDDDACEDMTKEVDNRPSLFPLSLPPADRYMRLAL